MKKTKDPDAAARLIHSRCGGGSTRLGYQFEAPPWDTLTDSWRDVWRWVAAEIAKARK